jgi:hypothetical protein
MGQDEAQTPTPTSMPPAVGQALDVVSKSVAAFAILLYGCGFLISRS